MKRILGVLGLWVLLVAPIQAQTLYFPPPAGQSASWDTLPASQLGYCPAEIDSLYRYLEQKNSKAFLILKDGRRVLEKYFGSFTRDSIWYWASAGKSLTSTLVGIAQSEGRLSIGDSTFRYLGRGFTACTPAQEEAITIRHQLSMTTGLDDFIPGTDPDCTDPACLQYLASPGSRWAYHNAPYTILDGVIAAATGRSLNQYVNLRLAGPIGFTGVFLRGGYNNPFYSTPRGLARFGLLMLARGAWNGTRVVDSAWIRQMWTPSQSLNASYGYLWWLNGQSSYMIPQVRRVFPGMLCPDAPAEMRAAIGKNGQIACVVPSQGLVIVRMGNNPDSSVLVPTTFVNEIWKRVNRLSCATSLREKTPEISYQLVPNPASEQVFLAGAQPTTPWHVSNIQGQKVAQGVGEHLSLIGLPKGLYWVHIDSNSGRPQGLRLVKN